VSYDRDELALGYAEVDVSQHMGDFAIAREALIDAVELKERDVVGIGMTFCV
jgi:hypothetical protein